MNAFLCFVLVAVAYVAAMIFLGRFLRARGHGSKLNALAAMHQKMREKFWSQRKARHQRSRMNNTNDPSE